jgi:hypothetical protein
MKQETLNQQVFFVHNRTIQQSTFRDFLDDFGNKRTDDIFLYFLQTPDNFELIEKRVHRSPRCIATFETYEDAENEMYSRINDFLPDDTPPCYSNERDAILELADSENKPVWVIYRYLRWRNVYDARQLWKQRDAQEKARKNKEIGIAEGRAITPDAQFLEEIKAAKESNKREPMMQRAFSALLVRQGITLQGDFWAAFREIIRK